MDAVRQLTVQHMHLRPVFHLQLPVMVLFIIAHIFLRDLMGRRTRLKNSKKGYKI